jgi:hypothetical protein
LPAAIHFLDRDKQRRPRLSMLGGERRPLGGDVEQDGSLMRFCRLRERDAFFGALAMTYDGNSRSLCFELVSFVSLDPLGYLAPPPFFVLIFAASARIGRLSRQVRAFGSFTQIPCSPGHWRNVSRSRRQVWSKLNR